MTQILTPLATEAIDNEKYERITKPFRFKSDVLKSLGFDADSEVPVGFVYDNESVPIVRGSNKRGGTAHDYYCRTDSVPVVTKAQAAAIYREIMEYTYGITDRSRWQRFKDFNIRWFKWAVVYVVPSSYYFHKHKVMATCEEITGLKGDPYIT